MLDFVLDLPVCILYYIGMTTSQELILSCIRGDGAYHPVIGEPSDWRTQGDCRIDTRPTPTAVVSAWADASGDRTWDAAIGDGYDVIGQAARTLVNGKRNHNTRDIIRFRASGYELNCERKSHQTGKVEDPYKPSVSGIGYYGEPGVKTRDPGVITLYKAWHSMIERCYNIGNASYVDYGATGVSVRRRWHSFAMFYRDVQQLPGYVHKRVAESDFALDKDHYGAKTYSPDTCLWLPREVNGAYISTKPFEVVSPDGEVFYHFSASEFARNHGLTQSKISLALTGHNNSTYKGWKFSYMTTPVRYRAYASPIRDSIQALLRGDTHEFDAGRVQGRVSLYEDAVVVEIDNDDEGADTDLAHAVYSILGELIARAVCRKLAHVYYNGDDVELVTSGLADRIRHPNDAVAIDAFSMMPRVQEHNFRVPAVHKEPEPKGVGGMPRKHDAEVGERIGTREVVAVLDTVYGRACLMRCECGDESQALLQPMRNGLQQSCRRCSSGTRKHGDRQTVEYSTWTAMHTRCYNPMSQDYPDYGGRGIVVDEAWRSGFGGYEGFIRDMGRRPTDGKYSIDRIDVNGAYGPGNCRWATDTEQARNRRNNRILTIAGESKPLVVWAEQTGVGYAVIRTRLRLGWSTERAVTEPTRT